MSEFHDNYPQYELMAHHSEEDGKKMRRKLWNVFWIMLAVTIVELIIGFKAEEWGLLSDSGDRSSTATLKVLFIGLTLAKAYYIVYKFMHLEHEAKFVKLSVIIPYTVFVLYLTYVIVAEANYSNVHKAKMDPIIEQQKIDLNAAAAAGGHDAQGGNHDAAGAGHGDAEEHHEAEGEMEATHEGEEHEEMHEEEAHH